MSAEQGQVLFAVYWIAAACFAAYLAAEKDRNILLWVVLTLCFNLIALVTIAGLPVVDLVEERAYEARLLRDDEIERAAALEAASLGDRGWDPRHGAPPEAP